MFFVDFSGDVLIDFHWFQINNFSLKKRCKSTGFRILIRINRRCSGEDVLQFSWQAQHFGCVHRHFAWQAQNFRRVLLRAFANRIARAASSGDKVPIPWQAWHFVRWDEN